MDNLQNDSTEQLLRYLDKEMSNDEQRSFEATLAANDQLRSELDGLQAARKAVILYGIKKQVSQIHNEERGNVSKEAPVVKMNSFKRYARYAIAAAACVVLIFVGIDRYNYSKLSADNLFAEAFTRFEPSNNRGTTVEITAIEKAYINKNFQQVIELYKSSGSTGNKEKIMAGNAYLETGKTAAAIEVFTSLLEKK